MSVCKRCGSQRDWLNGGHGYVQYTYEISDKEQQLLKLYGEFFR